MLFGDKGREAVEQSYMRSEIAKGMMPSKQMSQVLEDVWSGGEERRAICKKYRRMYDNDWRNALDAAIKKRFRPENYGRLMLVLDNSVNILRWVVNRQAGIYKVAPQRTLTVDGETIESPRYEQLLKETMHDATMLQVNRFSVLYREYLVGAYASHQPDGTVKIKYRVLAPDCCEVLTQPDDPTAIRAVIYPFTGKLPNGEPTRRYAYWDANHYREFDAQFKELTVFDPLTGVENKDKTNPFGVVPWVVFRPIHALDKFWHHKHTEGLYHTTLNGGVSITDIFHAIKNQSFKQVAITGNDLDKIDVQAILDPSQLLDLGSDGTAIVLDLQSNIPQLYETVMNLLSFTVHTYGIMPKAFRGSLDAQSGFALEVQERDLRDLHQEFRTVYAASEQQLYDVVRAVNNAQPGVEELPEAQLHVDYEDTGPGHNPQEVANYWTGLVNNDPPLADPITAMMKIHQCDEKQAEEMYAKALAMKAQATQMTSPVSLVPPMPLDPEPTNEPPPVEDELPLEEAGDGDT